MNTPAPDLSWLVACPGLTMTGRGPIWTDRHGVIQGDDQPPDLTDEDRAGIDEDSRFERTHDAAN